MKSLRNFLSRHRLHFHNLGLFLIAFGIMLCVTGCAGVPAWLTEAQSIIGQVGISIATIGSFIAGLTGNVALAAILAEVSTWITDIENGITEYLSGKVAVKEARRFFNPPEGGEGKATRSSGCGAGGTMPATSTCAPPPLPLALVYQRRDEIGRLVYTNE